MSDTLAPSIDATAALTAAAEAIADDFGLGQTVEAAEVWPIGEGDTVITAPFGGAMHGRLLLGVNDEVGGRLQGDRFRMTAGLKVMLAAFAESIGMELELGEPGVLEDGVVPADRFNILDDGRVTSVVGLLVDDGTGSDEDGDDAPGGAGDAPTAQPFDPAPVDQGLHGHFAPADGALARLHDVDMVVTAELGRTTMSVRELLTLQPGMVVEIDRAAGAPIDVLVNGKLIAQGEVVVIDEEFGIRISDIVVPGERH